uniref:Transmembrane 9 superfamily member n=1 Tax=Proboscia inermis TaxID=420281 RepID=A0A7S0C8R4_9STRA|mmetsp:Transcript_33566/g.33824  ORF Transcript_33566/g.33824 Transcript_33566/m.33824 type:complete len:456 (+) Transcript_33566:763-2130(+)
MSIRHRYLNGFEWDGVSSDGFTKPLDSCPTGRHVTRGDIQENQIIEDGEQILYTYDVMWVESPVRWASRWDVYLTEDHMVPAQVHWYSITNSILVVVFLSLLVISILVRSLKRDIAGYNNTAQLSDEELEEQIEESGWKLIHADVFRPPQNHPMLFCAFVGSGCQICIASFVAISFSAVGFLNPARRGSLMTSILVFYMLCGVFAGYMSSRFYKCFRGRQWQLCTLFTAVMFPGLCFCIFIFFNTVLAFFHSSGSVPFLDVLLLVFMWCGISIPLVFLGAFFGYKQQVFTFPTVTSTIARAIPEPTSMLLNPKLAMVAVGMVPFAAAYVELFFIMSSLWMDQFYYVFGFTLVVFLILLITTSEVTVLMCYQQLCAENHRWWWFSFITAGSTGLYTFLYSIVFFQQLNASNMIITHLLYFGYMFLLSFATFLTTGVCGFLTCFVFTRRIFGSIKVD